MQPSPSGVETKVHSFPEGQMPPQVGDVMAHGSPWNSHVQRRLRLTAHAWSGGQAPSHWKNSASPQGVVPATHPQPVGVTAQIGASGGQVPQQNGGPGNAPGWPHGANVVLVVELVVVVVVAGGGSLSAGRQSSTGFTTSSTSGRIWLLVETVVRGKTAPAGGLIR
jgi:hypothetical protein